MQFDLPKKLILPNIRKMFIPDEGQVLYDVDEAGADAQVVAWEAEDEDLKAAFRAGLKVHKKNAEDMWGTRYTHASPYVQERMYKEIKSGVHGTNYGARAKTLAQTFGWTVHEADLFQKRWFSMHPGIKKWHQRVESMLWQSPPRVHNAFGYDIIYFDRPENSFTKALAWIPQSTVALVCFKAALKLDEQIPQLDLLAQVHDSLVFQLPQGHEYLLHEVRKCLTIPIPYADPLTIPWGLASSPKSWGHVEEIEWPLAA